MKKITTLFVMLFCALSGLMAVTMTGGEKLYLTPNSNWKVDNARFAAYFFFETSNAWASMTAVAGETDLYEVTVPSGSWSNVIFCRMNPSATANNWTNKWNQSGDLVYDGTNNWYKVPSGQWDNFTKGWTIYTPPTPDPEPEPSTEVVIKAIRNRLTINTKDFKDFAGLYVSALPKAGDATVSYEWQFSSDGTSWAKYSAGDGATWDNIRPNTAGYYRCVLSYDLAGAVTTYTSNTLQITHNGGSQVSFSSKLPVILVRTAKDFPVYPGNYPNIQQVEEFKAKRSVDVKILWNEEGGAVTNADVNNADMLHYDRKARMNYRGSSSLYNPKRSYAFVSGDKNCDPKKLGEVKTKKFGMFGAAANKDWVLYASYPDATYMRNVLTYHQYSQMTGLWGAKCRYVELYIDGSYQGIYVFMDKITQDESRVNVNEDTGYIVKFDKTDIADRYSGKVGANEDYKRNTFTTSYTGKTSISTYNITVDQAFEIEYPEREDLAEFDDDGNLVDDSAWDAKVVGVKNRFEEMESAILANNYTKLATIIDYESWADYFIMNEFSRNADAYRISCVFTLNSLEDKIVANPMWDYELGWGNQDTKTTGLMVEDDKYYKDDFPTPFWWTGKGKSNCNGILGDCKFRAIVKERWAKHIGTNGALNSTVLNAKIDSLQTALRGGSAGTSVNTTPLKDWISNRTPALNSVISAWETCPVPSVSNLKISEFASVYVGETSSATATYTVANAKSVVASLSGSDAFSIVSESNGSVVLKFAPTAAGTFNGILTITADGIVSENIEFSASAISMPEISDLVAPVFTEIYVGETATGVATFSVANASDVEVELAGDAFSLVIKNDGSAEIEFAPIAAGTFNGILTITADEVVTETISFSATAILKPAISDLVAPVFTQIYVGETATGVATFSVANASDVEVELTGDAFSLVSKTDGSVEIEFAPSAAGTFNGTLTITADEVVTETISFSATAILKPVISDLVAPVFTQIYVGETTTSTATFSVENASDVEIELAGDAFRLVSKTEGSAEIEFAPIAAGTFNGTLTITADGIVTETISFSASAILKPVISDLVAPVFTQIYVGETATGVATFSVANASDVEVELAGDAFSLVRKTDGSAEIEFAPIAAGTFNGTLTITADEVVTETISFSATAILKPAITDIVAPVFTEIYVGQTATGVATFSVENAADVDVELSGEAFSILSEVDGSVEIVFTPTTAGTFNGTLTITADEVVTETISFSATAIESVTTSIDECNELNIYAKEGTIYCDEEFTIYNLAGVDVTSLNGSLQGVYLVVTANGNKQVSVW